MKDLVEMLRVLVCAVLALAGLWLVVQIAFSIPD